MTEEVQQHPPHSHVKFAQEIADIVEQRIWTKIAKWLLINLGSLVLAVAVGIGSYYSLESRVTNLIAQDNLTARQMDLMAQEHTAIKTGMSSDLREIKQEIGEINRYLRDHNNGDRNAHSSSRTPRVP